METISLKHALDDPKKKTPQNEIYLYKEPQQVLRFLQIHVNQAELLF
mgnify:CR=1 FL=1